MCGYFNESVSNFRFKELKMQKVIWEVVAYMLFLYMLMTVAYGSRDPVTNRVYDNYHNIFSFGSFDYQNNNKWGLWDADGVSTKSMMHLTRHRQILLLNVCLV